MSVPFTGGGEEFDPRSHKSFLLPGYENESLGKNDRRIRGALNALLWEAEVFADDDLHMICMRQLALEAGDGGKRAELMAQVAVHDEAYRRVDNENQVREVPEV